MPCVNVMKKIRYDKIEQCFIFGWVSFFFRRVESSTVVNKCCLRMVEHPGILTFSLLMYFSHFAIDYSYLPHMVRWMCVCLRKFVKCGSFVVVFEWQNGVCRVVVVVWSCVWWAQDMIVLVVMRTNSNKKCALIRKILIKDMDFWNHRSINNGIDNIWKCAIFYWCILVQLWTCTII